MCGVAGDLAAPFPSVSWRTGNSRKVPLTGRLQKYLADGLLVLQDTTFPPSVSCTHRIQRKLINYQVECINHKRDHRVKVKTTKIVPLRVPGCYLGIAAFCFGGNVMQYLISHSRVISNDTMVSRAALLEQSYDDSRSVILWHD